MLHKESYLLEPRRPT